MAKEFTDVEVNKMVASRLREMADTIEKLTVLAVNRFHTFDMWEDIETARKIMAEIPGSWQKEYIGDYVQYKKLFGSGKGWPYPDIALTITVNRSEVCRRIEKGTRVIPAQPERTVTDYEWECGPEDSSLEDSNG